MPSFLTRRVTFAAAHRYRRPDWSEEKNFRTFGLCARENYHGHSYVCDVTVTGEIDPTTGMVVAGIRTDDGKGLADARALLRSPLTPAVTPRPGGNTTLAVVATNARLTKAEVNRVALMADDGLSRAVSPSHTIGDGDTVFSLATATWQGQSDVTTIGALAADALSEAIVRAAVHATSSGGLPAARDLGTVPSRFR